MTTLYWEKLVAVVGILLAMVLICIFGKDTPPAVMPSLIAGLGIALNFLSSPLSSTGGPLRTVFKSNHPPPMPPADIPVIISIPPPPPPAKPE